MEILLLQPIYRFGKQVIPNSLWRMGSLAFGAIYKPSADYNLNLWGYSFSEYANTSIR